MSIDATVLPKIQHLDGGDRLEAAGTVNIDQTNGGKFKLDGTEVTSSAAELNSLDGLTADVNELNKLDGVTATAAELNTVVNAPATASLSAASSTSNVSLVTIQVKDGDGTNVAAVCALDVYLSDAATGVGLTATTASGAVAAGASGTDLGVLATKKALRVVTDATGKYILSITDTAKTHFYVVAVVAGKVNVSAQLADVSYG